MLRRVLLFIGMAGLMFTSPLSAADDVYNFYFQKAPGPQTVIQGSAAASTTPKAASPSPQIPAPSAASTTKAEVAQITHEKKISRRWTLGVGVSGTNDEVTQMNPVFASRLAISGAYNINRFLSVDASLKLFTLRSNSYGYNPKMTDLMVPTLGLDLMPVSISMFGADAIDAGIEGGLAYGAFNEPGIWDEQSSPPQKFKGYYGLVARINFPSHFSLRAHARTFGDYAGEYLGTLNYTF